MIHLLLPRYLLNLITKTQMSQPSKSKPHLIYSLFPSVFFIFMQICYFPELQNIRDSTQISAFDFWVTGEKRDLLYNHLFILFTTCPPIKILIRFFLSFTSFINLLVSYWLCLAASRWRILFQLYVLLFML